MQDGGWDLWRCQPHLRGHYSKPVMPGLVHQKAHFLPVCTSVLEGILPPRKNLHLLVMRCPVTKGHRSKARKALGLGCLESFTHVPASLSLKGKMR